MSDTVVVITEGSVNIVEVISSGPQGAQGPIGPQGNVGDVNPEMYTLRDQAAASAINAAASAATASSAQTGAETAQTGAETAQTGAQTAQTAAAASATTATTQASNASTSATTATTQASNASTSAATATTKAAEAVTSASNASTSATTATTQAGIATTKASEAVTSASNAATSATNAASSASSASTSATTATTKANDASAFATNSANSASTATTQAASATSSATAAATSASNASGHASQAGVQASNAAASAATATTQAGIATTQATNSATSATTSANSATASAAGAATSTAKASEAASSAAAINATFGNAASVAALAQNAQAAASLAQGYAASASSVVQQDLSGVTAQALHRSPNAVTAMTIYDTSKDSDGGAWTKRCQQTSWYNEALAGKWLGPEISEQYARYVGVAVGSELIGDPDLNDPSYWVVGIYTPALFTITGGQAIRQNNANAGSISAPVNLVAGKSYRVRVTLTRTRPTIANATANNYGSIYVAAIVAGQPNNVVSANKTGNPGDALDFYITPTVSTNMLSIISNTNTYTDIEAVSCREFTALNTASNDYFQLTTDGKFYRLWKNLFRYSEQFEQWGVSASAIVLANTQTAPDGTTTADTVTGSGSNFSGVVTNIASIVGQKYAASIYVKAGTSPFAAFLVDGGNLALWVNLSTGAVSNVSGTIISAVTTNAGNGWFRVEVVFAATGTTHATMWAVPTSAAGVYTGTGSMHIWGGQIEYGSAVTAYEYKGNIGTTSEIFRGNKAEFPKLAAIVAEAGNVNIYDLTEPGRPMWMRFASGATTGSSVFQWWTSGVTLTSCAALNSSISVGGSGNNQGLLVFSFAKDTTDLGYASLYVLTKPAIGERNQTGHSYRAGPGYGIANNSVNAVAMTVLPDAPIDPATGLRVPTIAVATSGGISVIKHNGTVVSTGSTNSFHHVYIDRNILMYSRIGDRWLAYALNPGSLGASFAQTFMGANPDEYQSANPLIERFSGRSASMRFFIPTVKRKWNNEAVPARGLNMAVASTFNTGWMEGDIRRAYLSDVTVGAIASEDYGIQTLTLAQLTISSTVTVSDLGDRFRITKNATDGLWGNVQVTAGAASLTVGRLYYAEFEVLATGPSNNAYTGASHGGGSAFIGNTYTTGYVKRGAFANATGAGSGGVRFDWAISRGSNPASSAAGDWIEVSKTVVVRRADEERSYKAQGAILNGTLTKSQLASGTSLVGYSGFSASNYLREPYSADLDFGTGEFTASAWVNFLTGPRYNLLTYTDTLRATEWGLVSNLTRVVSGGGTPSTGSGNYTRLTATAGNTDHYIQSAGITFVSGVNYTISYEVQYVDHRWVGLVWFDGGLKLGSTFDLLNGVVGSNLGDNSARSITSLGGGRYRISISRTSATTGAVYAAVVMLDSDKSFQTTTTSNLTATIVDIGLVDVRVSSAPSGYQRVVDGTEIYSPIVDRAFSSGPRITLGVANFGNLRAEAFDGTTTRTVTTTATYNTATWLKARASYTTDGSLAILVNGREVAATRGTPLLTLNSRYNQLTFTEQFDNAAWTKSGVTGTVSVLTAVAGAGRHQTRQGIFSGANATASIRFSPGTHLYAHLSLYDGGAIYATAIYQLQGSGTVSQTANSSGTVASSTITLNLDGSFTCTLTATFTSAPALNLSVGFAQQATGNTIDSSGIPTFTAAGTETLSLTKADARVTALAALPYQRVGAATDFDFAAPLTIGNNFALDAPFPGSIALLKMGATVPTTEQAQFMYEQEKQLFRAGAQSVLPDSGSVLDMAYDDATDRWVAVSGTNESYWTGLVRNSVTPVPAGTYTRIVATSGVELNSRITTNPGVDVSIPAYGLREELVRRAEAASRLGKELATYDYVGGFTGNITNGSTAIASVAGLNYPTSYIGARISGTGIPTNATVVAVSGTTIYISAAATATTSTLSITFLDFILPAGMETKTVMSAGAVKQEGSTKDYTRLFDGFLETIRFAAAPGVTAWVQIQAQRISQ